MPQTTKEKGKKKATANPDMDRMDDLDITTILSNAGLDSISLEEELAEDENENFNPGSDDDNDSLDQWIHEDQETETDLIDKDLMNDDEIIKLLNKAPENRAKLKTGDMEEFEREMEEFDNNLALTSGIGASRIKGATKKRILKGEIKLTDDEKRKLGEANALYISRQYGSAIDILQDIIQKNPKVHPAWNTLGLVHEELGNNELSLKFRMMGAQMCNDASLWKELGQKSIENDAVMQAIQCFTKALALKPTDVDALWDRAFLYKQNGRVQYAIDGFTRILELLPHHFKVINELAQLYRGQGRTKEAIKLYEDAIVYHTENQVDESDHEDEEEEDEFADKLGYSEINMLSELYLILNDYRRSLDTIKTGLRLVQKRQSETWWTEHTDDDDEYLEEDDSRTDFPMELRVRMGICRLYLGQVRIATRHFQYLLQYPATSYPDLHQDIAYAYYDKRHYDLALPIFQRIIDASSEIEVDLLIRTADCYRETNDLDTAVLFYLNVLEEQPDNLDVMMSLATVYEEQGNEEKALELVDYVVKKNREERRQKKTKAENETGQQTQTQNTKRMNRSKNASIFEEKHQGMSITEYYHRKRDEIKRREEEKTYSTLGLFAKLDELEEKMGADTINADRSLLRDYMRSAQELWNDFSNTSAFYPSERSLRYTGFYAFRKGKVKNRDTDNLNEEAHSMANRLRTRIKKEEETGQDRIDFDEEEKHLRQEEEEKERMIRASQFRGIPMNKWLRMIMRYAYVLTTFKRSLEAYNVLLKAISANVFYHDNPKKQALYLTMIGCGMIGKGGTMVQEGARWLCNYRQHKNDGFRIYAALVDSGYKDPTMYVSQNQLKYLTRMVRLMDAMVGNKNKENEGNNREQIRLLNEEILAMNIDPAAASENYYTRYYHTPTAVPPPIVKKMNVEGLSSLNPILLCLYGHMMTLSRSAVAASLFHMRAYAVAPKDRLNTLSLGISLLHTAIQRKSDDRHMQIVQGMMFIYEYAKLSGHSQESEYNIGRAFHLLGLTHLAVTHYEKVLCMPAPSKAATRQPKPFDSVYAWPISKEEEAELEEDQEDEDDLKSEAAYNLHLIYITSGSLSLAQILLQKYCAV